MHKYKVGDIYTLVNGTSYNWPKGFNAVIKKIDKSACWLTTIDATIAPLDFATVERHFKLVKSGGIERNLPSWW